MALAVCVGPATFHRAEIGVAGPEADGDHAFFNQPQADDAARIVAGPDDRLGVGVDTELRCEVGADRPEDGPGRRQRRQLFLQLRGGGAERLRMPRLRANVHEVHARAVAVVNRRDFAGQQRCEKGTDQRDVARASVCFGIHLVEFPDLGAGEPLEGVRTGLLRRGFDAAQFLANLGAFPGGGGIHPNRRSRARENAAQTFGQA